MGVIASGSFGVGLYLNQLKVFEEKLKLVQEAANNDTKLVEEKLNAAKKDTMLVEEKVKLAEERAEKETLKLLYNIFTQEEYKEAKKKLLAKSKD